MQGSCLCGAVRYALDALPPRAYRCRCALCRKQGSTVSNFAVLIERAAFRWLQGEDAITRYRRETGFSSHFCATCGSTVPNPLRSSPWVWVPLGGLEEPVTVETAVQLFVAHRAPWDAETLRGRAFDTMPDVEGLVAALAPPSG